MRFILTVILVFLLFCWVTAIANTFAKEKRVFSVEEKKQILHERIFFFLVFCILSVMIALIGYVFLGGAV